MSDTLSRRPPVRVLLGKLSWHPAVVAWRGLAGDGASPECIEVLREGKKSATVAAEVRDGRLYLTTADETIVMEKF